MSFFTENLAKIDPTTSSGLSNLSFGMSSLGLGGLAGGLFGGDPPSQEETQSEKAQAKIAAEQYNLARDLDFVRDAYKEKADSLDSEGAKSAASGRANISAWAQGFGKQAEDSVVARGVDPGSGNGLTTLDSGNTASGIVSGRLGAESEFAVDSIADQHRQNVISQAVGDSTRTVAGLSSLAEAANNEAAAKAMSEFNSKAATSSAIGTAAGLALAGPYSRYDGGQV